MNVAEEMETPSAAAAAATAPAESAPPHLVKLPGGVWNLWRWAGLRGTGFASSHVLKLAAPECAAAADLLAEAEEEMRLRKEEALDAVRGALDALKEGGQWEDAERRNPLLKALRDLNKGSAPAATKFANSPEVVPAVEAFRVASSRRQDVAAMFRHGFEEASAQSSRAIYEVAQMRRFQEAVIWQNRGAFRSALVPLLRKEPTAGARNSKQRQHEELVATYLQRYCLKNDTIGFFGPVGWARLGAGGEALTARPGPSILAERTVYFEVWGIDAFIEKLNQNKALRPWIAPRRLPYLHVEGTSLLLPMGRPMRLTPAQAAALKACDGRQTAREIVAGLMRDFPNEIRTETQGYGLLEFFDNRKTILWSLLVPTGLNPEKYCRQLIERIGDEQLRREALDGLDELERGREAVARAAGNPEELERALAGLDETFTDITAASSTRAAGKMYAARTLVYEDCRRDIEVEVGPQILEELGPPLSLLLTSTRWYTYQVAEAYRKVFREVYEELARQTGSRVVDAATFWYRVSPIIYAKETVGLKILPEFQRRWEEILNLPEGQSRVHYTTEELRGRVESAFAAPGSGWSTGRYHSPDVMIAAPSAEAIRGGDFELVMGELHLGTNTLRGSLFVAQHPHQKEIFEAARHDLGEDSIRVAPPKNWPGWTARTTPTLFPPQNYRLMVTHDSCCESESRALPIGSLVVEEEGGELYVRTRDGQARFVGIEAFADAFSGQSVNYFKPLRPRKHRPRITVDKLVIARESWAFSPAEFTFAYEKDDAERFLAARRWAAEQSMPRFVFVKSPVEVKPFYVDCDSPIYVDIFAKVVRRTKDSEHAESLITISEMHPVHEQSWLPDAEGQRFTSEFRIVAVDPVYGTPPSTSS
ncbi:MAG: lantibiotic dehydratase family protein [Acidobacteriota bacterium]|nr:lantibiotic dehydratase family protein [Acidobacteriota bacterium]